MNTDMYLSYSARKTYLGCPKAYHYRYILKDKTKGDPRDRMFGIIIGRVFEEFYNKHIWKDPKVEQLLLRECSIAIDDTFDKEGYVRGTDREYESGLKKDLAAFIPAGLEVIRKQKLLTPHSKAEVDLTVKYQSGSMSYAIKMGGRADFIHGNSLTDITILDGKASKHREKYVDSEQLVWYATQYYLKHSEAPKRLGFIFWSFPEDPVLWVSYTSDDMRKCVKTTIDVVESIKREEFEASPGKECNLCSYKGTCEEGIRHLAQLRVNRSGRIDTDLFDVEAV